MLPFDDPRANSLMRRLETIVELASADVPVALYASSIIPLVIDHDF